MSIVKYNFFYMYKAFGLQNTNVIYNVLYLQYFKSVDISGVPKRGTVVRPTAKQKTPPFPAIPSSRAKPRPTQTQRSRPSKQGQNRARHTSPNAALMHQPTPPIRTAPIPKPKPAKAPARTREPEIRQKSPTLPPIKCQKTSPGTPGTSKFPINKSTFKCAKSCTTSWLLLCTVPNLYLSPDLCLPLAF